MSSDLLMFLLAVIPTAVIWITVHYFRWYHGEPQAVRKYLRSIRRTLLAPLYYFCGYTCDICGKTYLFSPHKAFMCCPGLHNEKWRRDHPHEKCLTDPSTLSPTQYMKTIHGPNWVGDPDAYLRTCPWCGGTGRKYGVMCGECGGSGKLPR